MEQSIHKKVFSPPPRVLSPPLSVIKQHIRASIHYDKTAPHTLKRGSGSPPCPRAVADAFQGRTLLNRERTTGGLGSNLDLRPKGWAAKLSSCCIAIFPIGFFKWCTMEKNLVRKRFSPVCLKVLSGARNFGILRSPNLNTTQASLLLP